MLQYNPINHCLLSSFNPYHSGMVCYHKHRTKVHREKKSTIGLNTNPFYDDYDNVQEGTRDVSLEDALSALKMPLSDLNPEALGIVHRLDRGTSGCIIIAKNDSTHAKLVTAFFFKKHCQELAIWLLCLITL